MQYLPWRRLGLGRSERLSLDLCTVREPLEVHQVNGCTSTEFRAPSTSTLQPGMQRRKLFTLGRGKFQASAMAQISPILKGWGPILSYLR